MKKEKFVVIRGIAIQDFIAIRQKFVDIIEDQEKNVRDKKNAAE